MTDNLDEILFALANYAVQLPRQFPQHNYNPIDGMITGAVAEFIAEEIAKVTRPAILELVKQGIVPKGDV